MNLWVGLIWIRIKWTLWIREWNFGFRKRRGIFWVAQPLLASQEQVRFMDSAEMHLDTRELKGIWELIELQHCLLFLDHDVVQCLRVCHSCSEFKVSRIGTVEEKRKGRTALCPLLSRTWELRPTHVWKLCLQLWIKLLKLYRSVNRWQSSLMRISATNYLWTLSASMSDEWEEVLRRQHRHFCQIRHVGSVLMNGMVQEVNKMFVYTYSNVYIYYKITY